MRDNVSLCSVSESGFSPLWGGRGRGWTGPCPQTAVGGTCWGRVMSQQVPASSSLQEANAHLVIDVDFLQRLPELVEGDGAVLIQVGLLDGSLCDALQLLLRHLQAQHLPQNLEQLGSGDFPVSVPVVQPEGEFQLAVPAVGPFLLRSVSAPVLLRRTEVGQNSDKGGKVQRFLSGEEEGLNDSVSDGVLRQLPHRFKVLGPENQTEPDGTRWSTKPEDLWDVSEQRRFIYIRIKSFYCRSQENLEVN